MNKDYALKIDKIIKKNERLFDMQVMEKKSQPFILEEEYHLAVKLENEIFEEELQMTIGMEKESFVHLMVFLHPPIVNEENCSALLAFANEANMWLGSAVGRFWVNDNDFCYEALLPSPFWEAPEELEKQLFDKPFAHFRDCLTPLEQLKDNKWSAEDAVSYLKELRTNGFVDNAEYGLWE